MSSCPLVLSALSEVSGLKSSNKERHHNVGSLSEICVHSVSLAAHDPNEDQCLIADQGRCVGVFDGHGGVECSALLKKELIGILEVCLFVLV